MSNWALTFLTDSRTEWAVRYAVLHAIFYALYFYPPDFRSPLKGGVMLDWSLPVQLISGGNLAFYSAGWQAWFGLGAAFSMVAAGALLSAIFPLMQDNNLGAAYVCLMAMISTMALPLVDKIGVLNNLESLAFILIIIFTEVFYGPILNFRSVFEMSDIWTQVVAPNAIPIFAYIAIGWGIYMIPPWHSATYQMLQLSSQVTSGVAGSLSEASKVLKDTNEDNEKPEAAEKESTKEKSLRALANSLLEQTNYAGLGTPVALYGDMGVYETSVLYPHLSLRADSFQRLGKYLDETAFLIALQIWGLGEVVGEIHDEELLNGTTKQLEAAKELAQCIGSVLSCPRKNYRNPEDSDLRETIGCNPHLFDVAGAGPFETTKEARDKLVEASKHAAAVAAELKDVSESSSNRFQALILYNITLHMTAGQRPITHFEYDLDLDGAEGVLGRLMYVAETIQVSWRDDSAWPRMIYRMTYLEQFTELFVAWCKGLKSLSKGQYHPSLGKKRTFARFLQFLIGTLGLYAMATWWPAYSNLLGSSSTGQWTLVAFYVCLRATVEETVNAGLFRGIGHVLGAMLSWGLNTAITSSGGRITIHTVVTLILTWFIPPPFCVTPTKFKFPFDILSTNTLEGVTTTYHLTSVLVLATPIESAAKARALSQCMGSIAAIALSLCILPWFAQSEANKTLATFQENCKNCLANYDSVDAKDIAVMVEELLQAWRDIASAREAKSWCEKGGATSAALQEALTDAAFGGFALEAVVSKGKKHDLPETIATALKESRLKDVLAAIKHTIESTPKPQHELAMLYVDVFLLHKCFNAISPQVEKDKEQP